MLRPRAFLRFWPQLLATFVALAVVVAAFKGQYNSNVQTDKDLEAFIHETYLSDLEEQDGIEEVMEDDYFDLVN